MTNKNHGLNLKTKAKKVVEEVPYGVYLWQMPDGSFVADDEQHFYMISGTRGDESRMKALAKGVASFGVTEGRPVFLSGHRIVTDEEYEEQKLRLKFGLTPDIFDIASVEEDKQSAKNGRG